MCCLVFQITVLFFHRFGRKVVGRVGTGAGFDFYFGKGFWKHLFLQMLRSS